MIRPKLLLATVIIAGSLNVSASVLADNAAIDPDATPSSHAQTDAQDFIQYVNYARGAIAMKQYQVAKDNLVAAKTRIDDLKDVTNEDRRANQVQFGKVSNAGGANYYYPITTGPIQVKNVKSGPFWAGHKGIAVTDAEMVYLTLDLNDNRISEHLNSAISNLDKKNYATAQSDLASINDLVVKEDSAVRTPLVKARDNLQLASSFIEYKNYDGARFALHHANSALKDAENDPAYTDRKQRIIELQQQFADLEAELRAKDPTVLQKAGDKVKSWWKELKD